MSEKKTTGRKPGHNASSNGFTTSPKVVPKAPTPAIPRTGLMRENPSEIVDPKLLKITQYTNEELALSPLATPEDLLELAKYGDEKVRSQVATQTHISLETIELLSQDKNYDVLIALARNQALPKEFFRLLNDKVQEASYMYFTPDSKFQELGDYLLGNQKKQDFKLDLLWSFHDNFDEELFKEFSQDPDEIVRRYLVSSPNVSTEILSAVAKNDPKRKIRKLAKKVLANKN